MHLTLRSPILIATGLLAIVALSSCAKKEKQLHATIETSMGSIVVKLHETTTPKTVANFVGLADGTRLLAEGESVANAKPFYDGLTFHRVIPDFMIQGGDPAGNGSGGPGYQFEDETYVPGSRQSITGVIADETTAELVFETVMLPFLRQHRGNTPSETINAIFQKMNAAQSIAPMIGGTVEEIKQAAGYEGELLGPGQVLHPVAYGTLAMANAGPNTNGSQFFIVTAKTGTPWLDGKHTVFGTVVSGMEVAEAIQSVPTGPNDLPVTPVTIKSIRVASVKVPVAKE